jgi:hypothetical protein
MHTHVHTHTHTPHSHSHSHVPIPPPTAWISVFFFFVFFFLLFQDKAFPSYIGDMDSDTHPSRDTDTLPRDTPENEALDCLVERLLLLMLLALVKCYLAATLNCLAGKPNNTLCCCGYLFTSSHYLHSTQDGQCSNPFENSLQRRPLKERPKPAFGPMHRRLSLLCS